MTSQQEVMEPLDEEEELEAEYGQDREPGIAGPDAAYIVRNVERWRLRGEGYLK